MNSLPKYYQLRTPQFLVYWLCINILIVYKYIYKIKLFFDQAGTYTILQVLYLQIPGLNTKEIIKSTALKNREYLQNLI